MPKIDAIKEQIGSLKLYQGIVVATDIGVIGSLIAYATETAKQDVNVLVVTLYYLALAVGIVLFVYLHHQIQRWIKLLEEL